jgi:mutator protein MutT
VSRAALAAVHRAGRFLLQRRDARSAHLPGLWEFPGGKVEPGEDPAAAVLRELEEEIGWRPGAVLPLCRLEHDYGWGSLEFHLFLCEGDPRPRTELAWAWFTPAEMARLPMPAASLRLLPALPASRPAEGGGTN